MRGLWVDEILGLWEELRRASPARRALVLCARALDTSLEAAGELPLGRRDTALIELRRATFGDVAPCFVQCPACQAELELEVDLAQLLVEAPPGEAPFALEHEGISLRFRLPRSADVLVSAGRPGHAAAVDALVSACVLAAERDGVPLDARELPAAVLDALATRIAELDPMADIAFSLRCDACGHDWSAPFDATGYLWRELEVGARRLLVEVDAIARAYGWSEAEILGLSALRRRSYLELVGAS